MLQYYNIIESADGIVLKPMGRYYIMTDNIIIMDKILY